MKRSDDMALYYCIKCKKDIVHNKDENSLLNCPYKTENLPLMECPFCRCSETLYHFNEEDTKLLKGKRIDKIFHNEWADVSQLIIFEDGTHGIVERVDSETIEFRILEEKEGER